MSMTVKRRKDTNTPRVFMHRVADIRGGVSVNVSELDCDYLPEQAFMSVGTIEEAIEKGKKLLAAANA